MIPDLFGKRVRLVPMRLDEADQVVQWANADPARWFGRAATRAEVLERWPPVLFDDAYPQKGRLFRLEVEGKVMGGLLHGSIWGAPRQTNLELLLLPTGTAEVATDAIECLARWLFDDMRVRKVWAELPPGDERSGKAFQDAGFRQEKTTADGHVVLARMLSAGPERTMRKPK